jgi:hypothetical protein
MLLGAAKGIKTGWPDAYDRPAVLARVKEIGIDFAQGYPVHRPEPLEALLRARGLTEPVRC